MNKNEDLNMPAAAASPQPREEKAQVCDGAMKFCKALSSRLEDGYKKGINASRMMNLKTGKELAPLILYKQSASDHGLVLNYCPWCGRALNRALLRRHRRTVFEQGPPAGGTPQANPEAAR